jgi:formylglycine-generating enzyme required for sulfatase activity
MGETFFTQSRPQHSVTVQDFSILNIEVPTWAYTMCVDNGYCEVPGTTGECNYGVAGKEDHPINCVSWSQGKTFAAWIGGDYATEAEWEYAARGTDSRLYPWGDDGNSLCSGNYAQIRHEWSGISGCSLTTTQTTAVVGSRSNGVTPEGVYDLAGNVSEWTLDAYYSNHHGAPTDGSARCGDENCPDGALRTIKGGDYNKLSNYVRSSWRTGEAMVGSGNPKLGIRVVRIPLGSL